MLKKVNSLHSRLSKKKDKKMINFREWLREKEAEELNEAKLREYVVTVNEEEFDENKDRLALLMLSRFLKLNNVSYTGTGYSSNGFKELMKLDVKISGLVKKKKIINKDEPNFRRTIEGYVAVPGKEYKIKVDGDEIDALISKLGTR